MPVARHAPPTAYGPHLEGPKITLPLVLVRGFPFVEGTINGKSGKLLFDVGEPAAFAINSHGVNVPGAIKTGTGFFGSGQTFEVVNYPVVDDLKLPEGLHYMGMTNIRGNPGLPIEQHITADFIGWLGIKFFEGYVLKLDYKKPEATFYRDDALGSGEQAALAGERVIQVVRFNNKGRRNLLNFHVRAKDTELLALLDTGSHANLWVSDEQIAKLWANGSLQERKDGAILTGLSIDGHSFQNMAVEVTHGKPPMAADIPKTDDPVMTLGYEFLSRYKTVWDYEGATLTLLAR